MRQIPNTHRFYPGIVGILTSESENDQNLDFGGSLNLSESGSLLKKIVNWKGFEPGYN